MVKHCHFSVDRKDYISKMKVENKKDRNQCHTQQFDGDYILEKGGKYVKL